jgi:hypothetical protein
MSWLVIDMAFGRIRDLEHGLGWGWTREQLAGDVRNGLRQVRRNPAFSAVAIATLALGIGVNTAMFSAVDAVLIRPLPYIDAGRLVMIWDEMSHIGFPKHYSTPAEWQEWRRRNTVFTDIAATEPADVTLSGDEPEQVPGNKVTADLWTVPARPLLGRVFTEDEDLRGARVAVISACAVAAALRRVARSIGPHHHPERQSYESDRRDAARVLLHAGARYRHLDAGLVSRSASRQLLVARRAVRRTPQARRHPASGQGSDGGIEPACFGATCQPAALGSGDAPAGRLAGKTRTALIVLLCASAAILLISCVNLANLLLSRGAVRAAARWQCGRRSVPVAPG